MRMVVKRCWLRLGIGFGALLIALAFLGFSETVVGVVKAFATLGSSGIGDPSALWGALGEVIESTIVGLGLLPFGLALLVTCMVRLRRVDRSMTPPPLPPTS